MTQPVPSVDSLIEERRRAKRLKTRRRIVRFLSLVLVHGLLAWGAYVYFISPVSSMNSVTIEGNVLLSRPEILELLKPVTGRLSLLDFGLTLSPSLERHPLIKALDLDLNQSGQLKIRLEEYPALAITQNPAAILLENGTLVEITESMRNRIIGLPLISGYDDSVGRQRLAEALASIRPDTRLLIAEIRQEPLSYDTYYARLYMQDGIEVTTGLLGFKVLDDYLEIIKALNPAHDCIAIDETKGVPYSFPCTPS